MPITEWTDRTQRSTKEVATNNGECWTDEDLAFVIEFSADTTDEDIAIALGRTLYAIQTIRKAIDAGKAGSTRKRPVAAYRGWTEADGDGWS